MTPTEPRPPSEEERSRLRTLFCGCGPASEAAAVEMVRLGHPTSNLAVLTAEAPRFDAARALGLAVFKVRALTAAGIAERLRAGPTRVIFEMGDDHALALLLLALRPRFPGTRLFALSTDPGARGALKRCGATEILCVPRIAGLLLAATVTGPREGPGALPL